MPTTALCCIVSPTEAVQTSIAAPKPQAAASGDEAAELAKKLQNPVANLISVPFQNDLSILGSYPPRAVLSSPTTKHTNETNSPDHTLPPHISPSAFELRDRAARTAPRKT